MDYKPRSPPTITNVDDLRSWVEDELIAVASAMSETIALELRQVGRAPDKPREGMIISANGTTFNPGGGAGAYEYKGGAWIKL